MAISQQIPAGRTKVKIIVGLWTLLVLGCLVSLYHYDNRPGPLGVTPIRWPMASRLQAPSKGPMIVVFAHPKCPCSRATLEELAEILAAVPGRGEAQINFFMPSDRLRDWEASSIIQRAREISGLRVYIDIDGVETNRFHAETSGQTMVFDPHGTLVFSGGITGSRGHRGDNAGKSAVQQFLVQGSANVSRTLAFGCRFHRKVTL